MDTVGINNKVTKFDLLLTFMGSHNHDPYDERTGDAPDHVQQSDFFGVGESAATPATTSRKCATLPPWPGQARMLRKARMIGFEDSTTDKEAKYKIRLEWVDPESLDEGFARQSFTVDFDCCDESNDV